MHEAADERFVDAGVKQPAPISVTVAVRRCPKCLTYFEANALAGGSMCLVVLGERIHFANGPTAQIYKGEGVVAFYVHHLL